MSSEIENEQNFAKGEEIMSYAKISLLFDHPYLGPAVWGCKIIPVDNIPNTDFAGIDKWWRLYYIPKNWAKLEIPQATTILYHELMHALRDHSNRGMLQIPQTKNDEESVKKITAWGLATDCEINDDLAAEKMVFPTILNPKTKEHEPYAVFPMQFQLPDNETAEFYLKKLKNKVKVTTVKIGFGNGDGCGSGADGIERNYEKGDGEGKEDKGGKDAKGNPIPNGLSETEKEILRRMVAEEIKSRGTTPGHWQRWAENILHPKVNWYAAFMAALRSHITMVLGKTDYTWAKLSRRQNSSPFIYPALIGPQPKVVVITDTSGSMGDTTDLPLCSAEVQGILRATGCDVIFMSVDAKVHVKKRIRSVKQAELKGGGGTDMTIGIKEAEKYKPDFIVVLTDGYTPWPKNPPKFGTKLLIGLTQKPNRDWAMPKEAKVFNLWDK